MTTVSYLPKSTVSVFLWCTNRYFSASSMKDVFENVNAQRVIDFIKEINFYHEL